MNKDKQLSSCCQASIEVDTADEGTGNHICTKCKQCCDPMKDKPTAEEKILDKHAQKQGCISWRHLVALHEPTTVLAHSIGALRLYASTVKPTITDEEIGKEAEKRFNTDSNDEWNLGANYGFKAGMKAMRDLSTPSTKEVTDEKFKEFVKNYKGDKLFNNTEFIEDYAGGSAQYVKMSIVEEWLCSQQKAGSEESKSLEDLTQDEWDEVNEAYTDICTSEGIEAINTIMSITHWLEKRGYKSTSPQPIK